MKTTEKEGGFDAVSISSTETVIPETPSESPESEEITASSEATDLLETEAFLEPEEIGDTGNDKPAEDVLLEFVNDKVKCDNRDNRLFSDIYEQYCDLLVDGADEPLIPKDELKYNLKLFFYDIDEDGENELVVDGLYYGYDIYDARNNKVFFVTGGASSVERCEIARGNNHIYLFCGGAGGGWEDYSWIRYGSDGNIKEKAKLYSEYGLDGYDENSKFFYNDVPVSMQEYEEIKNSFSFVEQNEFQQVSLDASKENGISHEDKSGWKEKYSEYLKESGAEWFDPGEAAYSLVYVDDDDVPELIVRIGDEDGRYFAVTYKDEKFDYIELLSGSMGSELDYIPMENRLRCVGIYSDGVSETIYGIDGNTWNKLLSGSDKDIFNKEEAEDVSFSD